MRWSWFRRTLPVSHIQNKTHYSSDRPTTRKHSRKCPESVPPQAPGKSIAEVSFRSAAWAWHRWACRVGCMLPPLNRSHHVRSRYCCSTWMVAPATWTCSTPSQVHPPRFVARFHPSRRPSRAHSSVNTCRMSPGRCTTWPRSVRYGTRTCHTTRPSTEC